MRVLLSANADIGSVDRKSRTALHNAASAGSTDCCNLLLRSNADMNATDGTGATPLQLAVKNGHVDASLELLHKWPEVRHVYG